ncbi:MAG: hypothetical protein ACREME_09185 [Gemmatimonadales bacterium]
MRCPTLLLTTATVFLCAATTAGSATAAGTLPSPASGSAPALVAPIALPAGPVAAMTQDIEVDVDDGGEGAWYTQPVWIAIGVIALIVIILLIAMAGRGGGRTTVVK